MEPSKDIDIHIRLPRLRLAQIARGWLPSRGSVVFTLLVCSLFFFAQTVSARQMLSQNASSIAGIPYQGRLANADGIPVTGNISMIFRLYSAATGGVPLWEENWTGSNSVVVKDGLFNVMLGNLTPLDPALLSGNQSLWLGITAGSDDEMTPRVQLGSVPYAFQALTVPDGAITGAKLANSSVNTNKLGNNAVTNAKLADASVSLSKLGADVVFTPPDNSVTTAKLADNSVTGSKVVNASIRSPDVAFNSGSLFADIPGDGWYLVLTTSHQEIPGTAFSVNPQTNQRFLLFVTLDCLTNNSTVITELLVDGTPQSNIAVCETMGGSVGTRMTVSQTYVINLSAGTHTFVLRSRLFQGTSGFIAEGHTTISYFSFAQP